MYFDILILRNAFKEKNGSDVRFKHLGRHQKQVMLGVNADFFLSSVIKMNKTTKIINKVINVNWFYHRRY